MLNGWVYFDIIRNFWVKAYLFYEATARDEVKKLVQADKSLKGKTEAQVGLSPFGGTKIRYNLLGIQVVITQAHIAKMLELDNAGENVFNYNIFMCLVLLKVTLGKFLV
jgi:hypothetical protein